MLPDILSDKPVQEKENDKFQRYDFSKRIADKILESNSTDSVVIGIYGAWGEGKTSIINFIEKELKTNDSIIPIRFNPWQFNEEAALLVSFFNTMASEVKISSQKSEESKKYGLVLSLINRIKSRRSIRKEPLKTKTESIGDLFEKYGKIVSVFGAGEAAESLGKLLSNVNIETLKSRLEALLIESKKKLVVFIDDIDRLDKQEIHAIFRLVKLTADFSNTFYILSFDHEMVASAIGERFGEGDKQAGLNFIEKIIQVPLNIPVAQPEALQNYCIEFVNKSINENNIELTDNDVKRYVAEFSENVLIRLKTPRLAVRYGNSLSFSFPLLKGEVNLVDLMLVEALKIFYPTHYEFVKGHSHYFLSSYDTSSNHRSYSEVEARKKELTEHLDNLAQGFSKSEKESVKRLLSELFPRLDEAFKNTFRQNGDLEWFKSKRISSPSYFKRYFSYSVIKGEISDISFDGFISSVDHDSEIEIINSFKKIIETSSVDNFLYKIRSHEDDYTWERAKKIALSIAYSGELFSDTYSFLRFTSPKSQAAIFIYQVLKKHEIEAERFDFAKTILSKAQPYDFAYDINYWFKADKTDSYQIFNKQQLLELSMVLINRAIVESEGEPIFIKFPDCLYYTLNDWKEVDSKKFDEYFRTALTSEPQRVVDLLRALTSSIRSSNHPKSYKTDFTKEQYQYFISLFDKEYIHKIIVDLYFDEINAEAVRFTDKEDSQTDINILRQFNHWYEKEQDVTEA